MADISPNGGSMPDSAHTLPQGKNTLMAILAYIGPLVIVSYLVAKDDPFVKFHIKQGLVLFVAEVVIMLAWQMLWGFLWPIAMLVNLLNLALLVLSIIGIVNAAQGNEKALPLVGGFSKHFPI
jgi:uncharacterized membrane protein